MQEQILRRQPRPEPLKELSDKKNNSFFLLCKYANDAAADAIFQAYGRNKQVSFPVDIRRIVSYYGIDVYETKLNVNIGFQLEKTNGYLKKWSEDQWRIYLDSADSEQEKRYVLAHELSHFLLEQGAVQAGCQGQGSEMHCLDPFFPTHRNEMIADVLASFLLFPPKCVLEYFEQYTLDLQERNVYPIDAFEWIRVLGQKAQVSPYAAIICYQYLKYYLCYLYETEPKSEMVENYRKFFKG